jgi:uncharacterized RDD family membrane protein YckC
MSAHLLPERDIGLQGHFAGVFTRFVSFWIDLIVVGLAWSVGASVTEYILSAITGRDVNISSVPWLAAILIYLWWFVYTAYPLGAAGRTLGMALVGVRAVHEDGSRLTPGHAVIRVLVFPLSFLLFTFGFVLIMIRRDRRALHDLIAGSSVVYAWDARAARLRFLADHPAT